MNTYSEQLTSQKKTLYIQNPHQTLKILIYIYKCTYKSTDCMEFKQILILMQIPVIVLCFSFHIKGFSNHHVSTFKEFSSKIDWVTS
jgi:hypothetical protein